MTTELSDLPFQTAFARAPLGMFFSDTDGCFIAINEALNTLVAQELVAQETDTLIGNHVTAWFEPSSFKTASSQYPVSTNTHISSYLQGHYQLNSQLNHSMHWQFVTVYLSTEMMYVTTLLPIPSHPPDTPAVATIDNSTSPAHTSPAHTSSEHTSSQHDYLQALHSAIPDGILYFDRNGICTNVRQPTTFTSYRPYANVVGAHISRDLSTDDAEHVQAAINTLFLTRQTQYFEHAITLDNHTYYRENRFVRINNYEGLVLVRDITEKKHAELDLQAQTERLLALYQGIPDNIAVISKDCIVVESKPPREHEPHHFTHLHIGKPLENSAPEHVVRIVREKLAALFAGGEIQEFIYSLYSAGKTRYREGRLVKLNDHEALALMRDITEKKHAELALQESKKRLDLAIDAARLGVWDRLFDSDVVEVNDHLRHMLGLTAADVVHLSEFQQGIHPTDLPVVNAAIAEIYSGHKEHHSHQRRQRHSDGSYRWLNISGAIVERDMSGQPRRIVSIIQDIHEQKTTQLRLEQALIELEQALKDKDILIAEVHHRVKNNMQVIGSIMSLHARKIAEPAAKATLIASRSRIRAMAAIHEVMYNTEIFSDLQFGIYLQTIARSLVQLHYRENHRQQTYPPPQLHFELAAVSLSLQDALPCALIFNELLSNALNHAFPNTFTGQPVIIIHLQEEADNVTLRVIDNGIGSSGKIKNFGSFIIDSLVEQLQGTLDISSHTDTPTDTPSKQPNTGTTAIVKFSKVLRF